MSSADAVLRIIERQSLEKAPVYVLSGSDDFLIGEVLEIIRRQSLDKDFADFNHTVVECTAVSKAPDLIEILLELPMLCEQRLLELHNAQLLPSSVVKEIAQTFEQAAASGQVIICLTWKSAARSSKGGRTSGKTASSLKGLAESLGLAVNCDISDNERTQWIEMRLKALELKFSGSIVHEIAERTGSDLQHLAGQLNKLKQFKGDDPQVTLEDIRQTIKKSAETKIWEYTSAVADKNLPKSIETLDAILEDNPMRGALGLLSYTNTYLRSLAQIYALSKRYGPSLTVLSQYVRDKKDYQIRRTLQELQTWSELDLRKAFATLCRADRKMKSGGEPYLIMQLLTLQMCKRQGQRPSR